MSAGRLQQQGTLSEAGVLGRKVCSLELMGCQNDSCSSKAALKDLLVMCSIVVPHRRSAHLTFAVLLQSSRQHLAGVECSPLAKNLRANCAADFLCMPLTWTSFCLTNTHSMPARHFEICLAQAACRDDQLKTTPYCFTGVLERICRQVNVQRKVQARGKARK